MRCGQINWATINGRISFITTALWHRNLCSVDRRRNGTQKLQKDEQKWQAMVSRSPRSRTRMGVSEKSRSKTHIGIGDKEEME
eukprot:6178994-Pleurochrysis_carterae.AAC.3